MWHIKILEMIVVQFGMQGEDVVEHIDGKCHVCTFQSAHRLLSNIGMHFICNTSEHT